ncbi:MAG: cell division protein FtsL [Congregibacter sp.]
MSIALRSVCVLAMLLGVVLSAFAVIASTHQTRALYAGLQDYEAERWDLEEEHSRLLIEQSTWASHNRIESEAGDALGLGIPSHAQTRLVPR